MSLSFTLSVSIAGIQKMANAIEQDKRADNLRRANGKALGQEQGQSCSGNISRWSRHGARHSLLRGIYQTLNVNAVRNIGLKQLHGT